MHTNIFSIFRRHQFVYSTFARLPFLPFAVYLLPFTVNRLRVYAFTCAVMVLAFLHIFCTEAKNLFCFLLFTRAQYRTVQYKSSV